MTDYRRAFINLGLRRKTRLRRALEIDVRFEQLADLLRVAQIKACYAEVSSNLTEETKALWAENNQIKSEIQTIEASINRILAISAEIGLGLSRELLA